MRCKSLWPGRHSKVLFIDQHDVPTGHPVVCGPSCIACGLSQLLPVEVASLNPELPDFYFVNVEGKGVGVSRKQVGEMLGGLDRVEEQLRRDYEHVDSLHLVVEGILLPSGGNECQVAERSGDWFRLRGSKHSEGNYRFSYVGYRKKLASFRRWGITVTEVPTRETFITEIQSLYENEMTPFEDLSTFRKPIRSKFDLPPDASAFVKTLMCITHPSNGRTFIGVETAQALESAGYKSLGELILRLDGHTAHGMSTLPVVSEVTLASGRRIGKAMEGKMVEALL
jgi:hypothetical protein